MFDKKDLKKALEVACTIHAEKKQAVLIEEKLEGMEFSCITITDYKTGTLLPMPPTEIVPEAGTHFFDYEQKYMPGKAHKFTPPRRSPAIIKKIQDTCVRVMQALNITNISRIDGFVIKDNRVVIVDPNSLSGMAPASFLFREAAEINMGHTELINHLIETELHKNGMLTGIQKYKKDAMAIQQKKRVAVLMGGATNEKEISLETGRNITYKLSPHKYEAIPLFVTNAMELYKINQSLLVRNSTSEIASMLKDAEKVRWHDLAKIVDFVFIGLHGGLGENGGVQGALEMLGLPYNGSSVLASGLCMDKYKTAQFLNSRGFDVPASFLIDKTTWNKNKKTIIKKVLNTISLPLVVKPHDDGCSVMVAKANSEAELAASIEHVFKNKKKYALVEEFIAGIELTVGVIGNQKPFALPPSQAVAKGGVLSVEEKFLPGLGENQTPAPLPNDVLALVRSTMEDVYKTVDCKGYARIDCFYQSA